MKRLAGGALICAWVFALAGCGSASDPARDSGGLQRAESFDAFPLYFLGASFEGDDLEFSGYGPGKGTGIRRAWSFIYGDCTATSDSGCAPPLEIQNWSICTRFPALYGGARQTTTLNGVETLRAGGGLEVYTGTTTVVIFGGGNGSEGDVVQSLRRLGEDARELPQPVPGALAGKLPCQADRLRRFED